MRTYLHVSTHDSFGAGIATRRLHLAMLSAGIDSRLVVRNKLRNDPAVTCVSDNPANFRRSKALPSIAQRVLFRSRYCVYSAIGNRNAEIVKRICCLAEDVDVLVLHWVAYFLTVADIEEIASTVKCQVAWYALDMAPFTGGCHYSWGCEKYSDNCDPCRAAGFGGFAPFMGANRLAKKALFDSDRVKIIAPNQWVRSQAERAIGKRVPVAYIPVSGQVFGRSIDDISRYKSRQDFRIFFGYADFLSERKGARHFAEAMKALKQKLGSTPAGDQISPLVLLPGTKADDALARLMPFDVLWIGRALEDTELAALYEQADCFVNTAIEDSGPLMVSEALMSGLPVVSFDVGIAREIIRDGQNGYVVETGDAEALADSLLRLMTRSRDDVARMALAARDSVLPLMNVNNSLQAFESCLE